MSLLFTAICKPSSDNHFAFFAFLFLRVLITAFLSDQCKEIEENNRLGKTRDLFKKIRDTKGILHAKMGTIKTEMVWTYQKQMILRRGGKNTQNYIKKGLNDPENHNVVVTHAEPDIL